MNSVKVSETNCEDVTTGCKENPILFMPTFETLLKYTERLNNRKLSEEETAQLYQYFLET